MAYEITNASKGRVTIRVVGTGVNTINLADLAANTVTSANASVVSVETVRAATISQAHWTANTGNAYWSVKRGLTEVLQLPLAGSIPFNHFGMSVANNSTGTIVVELVDGGTGTLILEVTKDTSYSPSIE